MSFCLAARIEAKTGTLEINQLGGLAKSAPNLAFLFGLVGMASIGLPGLANFAGEIMVFFSGFEDWSPADGLGAVQIATIIAIWGVVISAVYMLRAFRNIFHGETVNRTENATPLSLEEKIPAALLALILLIVGIYPQAILNFLN
jgi:NADH-quinone oxidoreductase subunit M